MKKFLFSILVGILFIQTAIVDLSAAGETGADFLLIPKSVRAHAMGSAFTAIATGPDAIYFNPAGLVDGVFNEATLTAASWINDSFYGKVSYRHALDIGGFGAGLYYFNSGEISKRPDGRASVGSYAYQAGVLDAAQGLKLTEAFNVGLGMKLLFEMIDGESATALAGSAGAQYNIPIDDIQELYLGLVVENLGTSIGYKDDFSLPALVRLGVADVIFDGTIKATADLKYLFAEGIFGGGVGVEYSPLKLLDIRAGYRFGNDIGTSLGLTGGIGIRYIDDLEYVFDITAASMGELGMSMMIAMGIVF
ncbi:MAG: PorV/PorQ family protein [Elusimicrobia bacterium]|nr:PorV/PorQ family protein [Elusimicrobiota bacterium]